MTTAQAIDYTKFIGMSAQEIQLTYYRGQGLPPNWDWDLYMKVNPGMPDPRTTDVRGDKIDYSPEGVTDRDVSMTVTLIPGMEGNLLLPGALFLNSMPEGDGSISFAAMGVVIEGAVKPLQYHGLLEYQMDGGAWQVIGAYSNIPVEEGTHAINFREATPGPNPLVLRVAARGKGKGSEGGQ